ncbi:MAG TPA: hypothetical protein VFQ85_09280 [Mycobacteriales bacterium]|jgi:hypothetical protein|nr:hypothetical protein [Mycobacteriales bacterium]
MRILVVEDRDGDSTDALLDLVEAGHTVVRCQPVGGELVPCAGLRNGSCPLDQPVDLVVDVHTGEGLSPRELGAFCAIRAGATVVTVGHSPAPFPAVRTTAADLVETVNALAPAT